jgi:hypothetical protein
MKRNTFLALYLFVASIFATTTPAQVVHESIKGTVQDQSGALIVSATVTLAMSGKSPLTTQSDERGQFEFKHLAPGVYAIRIEARGFGPYEETLDSQSSSSISITLYPTVNESVTVDSDEAQSAMDPERAAGSLVLKATDIAALPDDPDDLSAQLQMLASTSGSAPGGATVTVDGFIVHGRLPAKGSIGEIRINPDLYSAEYDKPPYRGGRIEILTKPGAEAFHGSGFLDFNDSRFNARNAFAATKPDSSTRRFGFDLGGPIVVKQSGFFLNFERREIDEAGIVNAIILDSNFQPTPFVQNVPAPARLTTLSARFDWQMNKTNTFAARYDFNINRLEHQGAGGFNLAERGFNTNTVEHTFRFNDTTVVGSAMINEARLGITSIRVDANADSNAPGIVVPGAFASGGANLQSQHSSNLNLEIGDNFSLVTGKHKLKLGALILGRLSSDSRSDNFNGTFVFGGNGALINISGLEQYRRTLLNLPGGSPTRFSIVTGDPLVEVDQWLFSAYAQDEWKLRRHVSITMGVRYEGQTNPADRFSIAPRVGVAYSVDKKQHWILRARVGLFYSRIPDSVVLDADRLDGQHQQQVFINNPSFPDPFSGGNLSTAIPTIKQLQSGLAPEASWQMQFAVEHQLPRGWKLNISQSYARGRSTLRTVNINAPLVAAAGDPATAPRPLGVNENILEYQATGETRGPVTFIGLNQAENRHLNLFSGYLYFHLRSNADTPATQPQSSFSQTGEWARPFWQSTHRVFIAGTVFLPWKLRASPYLSAASGTPFNITTGRDNNGDGSFTDRPSIVDPSTTGAVLTRFGALLPQVTDGNLPRNFGTNPATVTLDVNLARDFSVGKRGKDGSRLKLTVNARVSNLFNRVNVTGLNGVLTSPFFDRANSALPARKIEFGARISF